MNRIRYSLIPFVLLSASLNAQNIKPYLQSPTPSSVWITWKTDSITQSVVSYGPDSISLHYADTGTCQILTGVGYDSSYYYHSVKLSGLEPDQYYYYRAWSGTQTSAIYRFRTQPPVGQNTGIYRFLIMGDHQNKNNDRYERLMKAAKDKVFEKFGGKTEDHIRSEEHTS